MMLQAAPCQLQRTLGAASDLEQLPDTTNALHRLCGGRVKPQCSTKSVTFVYILYIFSYISCKKNIAGLKLRIRVELCSSRYSLST